MGWWRVPPSSAPYSPPSFPLTVPKMGGGTVTLVSRNWQAGGTGRVVGVDAGGGRWLHREADGLVEPE
jgi:hypothetical protein